MTKRYSYSKSELTDLFVISDELHKETFSGMDDEYNCSRIVRKLNTLTDENEQLRKENDMFSCELSVSANKEISRNCRIAELEEENKALQKKLYLIHMSSMFSTVKSFKGDISKRYKYSEKTDMIYDTANHYGKYNKVLDKKEITMLLNEYNTLLEGSK